MASHKVWIIMADQLSFRHIACHGHKPWMVTPNLDKFSSKSISFRRAYCSSPLCVPSRQSFYTGRTTRHHRCICDMRLLRHNTMFHHLGDLGIPSFGIGKMDFRFDHDQFHGLTERPGNDIGAQDMEMGVNNSSSFNGNPVTTTNREIDEQCEVITNVSLECLEKPGSNLVFTSFLKPHESLDSGIAYNAPNKFYQLYNHHCFEQSQEWGYAANVSCLDYYVGQCLEKAKDKGLLDDTLVIFCGDHGEMAGKYGRWGKLCMFEEAIRVPMILWHKDVVSNVVDSPVALIDLFPTIFQWFGVHCPPSDGISLFQQRKDHVFVEYFDGQLWGRVHNGWNQKPLSYSEGLKKLNRAIIQDEWKIIHDGTNYRLFHIENDLEDLSLENPKVFYRLKKILEEYPAEGILDRKEFKREMLI